MTETQWGGLCYLLSAVFFMIWWRLRIEAELDALQKQDEDDED